MRVTLYDASFAHDDRNEVSSRPLDAVPSVEVEVQDGWTVSDVLVAGGHRAVSSFALLTPEIEADVAAGEYQTVAVVGDLVGIDDDGRLRFQWDAHLISWVEFLRATEVPLYRGDPTRIVVYPYGAAGGPEPDGLWETVQWLFDNRDLALNALEDMAKVGVGTATLEAGRRWITGLRRKQIASDDARVLSPRGKPGIECPEHGNDIGLRQHGHRRPKPRGFALTRWYHRRLILATHVSPDDVNTLVRVEHFITPGSVVLRPTMTAKVLSTARHAGKAQPSPFGLRRIPKMTPAATKRGQ